MITRHGIADAPIEQAASREHLGRKLGKKIYYAHLTNRLPTAQSVRGEFDPGFERQEDLADVTFVEGQAAK
jgi:hypothetical protein